jgi:hypothetical protein
MILTDHGYLVDRKGHEPAEANDDYAQHVENGKNPNHGRRS